jgi:hypothetical protein
MAAKWPLVPAKVPTASWHSEILLISHNLLLSKLCKSRSYDDEPVVEAVPSPLLVPTKILAVPFVDADFDREHHLPRGRAPMSERA